jgi:choice-of-anchor B domain-containing protein
MFSLHHGLRVGLSAFICTVILLSGSVVADDTALYQELLAAYKNYDCENPATSRIHACRCWQLEDAIKYQKDNVSANDKQDIAAAATCTNGYAGLYPCNNVDLSSFVNLAGLGGVELVNDIWGWTWTNATTKREFAIVGGYNATLFVEITDPANPKYLGKLNGQYNIGSLWRGIKVYKDHAFIVSEAANHGMQVFSLAKLLSINPASPVVYTTADAHYAQFGNAHNIAINENSGFAYAVGSNMCNGGLHMINISAPLSPSFAGCYSADNYTHDVQCVTYNGAHTIYKGREICFAANEDSITIVDVTNKNNPVQLSRKTYPNNSYVHQGWLTDDHNYFFIDEGEGAECSFVTQC